MAKAPAFWKLDARDWKLETAKKLKAKAALILAV